MADERSPRDSEPIPSDVDEKEDVQLRGNPAIDDDDVVSPGIVPPEAHELEDYDNEATGVHESRLQEYEEDLAVEYVSDTQHTDGSTYNPSHADEQGLVYTPPTDPPVAPGDDYQGADIAAGLAPTMEASNPDVVDLPDHVDNNDWDLVSDIKEALRDNSETRHLADRIEVQVEDGVVTTRGTVESADDLGRAERVIEELDGVRNVYSEVELDDESVA